MLRWKVSLVFNHAFRKGVHNPKLQSTMKIIKCANKFINLFVIRICNNTSFSFSIWLHFFWRSLIIWEIWIWILWYDSFLAYYIFDPFWYLGYITLDLVWSWSNSRLFSLSILTGRFFLDDFDIFFLLVIGVFQIL